MYRIAFSRVGVGVGVGLGGVLGLGDTLPALIFSAGLQRNLNTLGFCEARRAPHCHSPQTAYSSKSTCCAISAQNSAMHVVVYAGRLTSQRSIFEIINW